MVIWWSHYFIHLLWIYLCWRHWWLIVWMRGWGFNIWDGLHKMSFSAYFLAFGDIVCIWSLNTGYGLAKNLLRSLMFSTHSLTARKISVGCHWLLCSLCIAVSIGKLYSQLDDLLVCWKWSFETGQTLLSRLHKPVSFLIGWLIISRCIKIFVIFHLDLLASWGQTAQSKWM